MKVREVLEHMRPGNVSVVGKYKGGQTRLYKGSREPLLEILRVNDIMTKKNWGSLNPDTCFLTMDVENLSASDGGIWISVKMPDSYTDKDLEGNALDEFI